MGTQPATVEPVPRSGKGTLSRTSGANNHAVKLRGGEAKKPALGTYLKRSNTPARPGASIWLRHTSPAHSKSLMRPKSASRIYEICLTPSAAQRCRRSRRFHGGDTGSNPVGDASYRKTVASSRSCDKSRCFRARMTQAGHATNLPCQLPGQRPTPCASRCTPSRAAVSGAGSWSRRLPIGWAYRLNAPRPWRWLLRWRASCGIKVHTVTLTGDGQARGATLTVPKVRKSGGRPSAKPPAPRATPRPRRRR